MKPFMISKTCSLDIGASKEEEAKRLGRVRPGDMITPHIQYKRMA